MLVENLPPNYKPSLPGRKIKEQKQQVEDTEVVPQWIQSLQKDLPVDLQELLNASEQCMRFLPWNLQFMDDLNCITNVTKVSIEERCKSQPKICMGVDPTGRPFVVVLITGGDFHIVLCIFQRFSPLDSTSQEPSFDINEKTALDNCWRISCVKYSEGGTDFVHPHGEVFCANNMKQKYELKKLLKKTINY